MVHKPHTQILIFSKLSSRYIYQGCLSYSINTFRKPVQYKYVKVKEKKVVWENLQFADGSFKVHDNRLLVISKDFLDLSEKGNV